MNHFLFLLALFLTLPALAEDIDLSSKVGPGKWALNYLRVGELKPLHLSHKEEGVSYTCIDGDPRIKILTWIKSKGCTVHNESFENNTYRMTGECELRWWKGSHIPVSVELRPENRKAFTLDIRTEGNSVLGFTEHTKGTNIGPCDPVQATTSAFQGKQDQKAQP